MDNEKAKRIRNAHRAFVEKTMEGATRILVEQTADHVEDSSIVYEGTSALPYFALKLGFFAESAFW